MTEILAMWSERPTRYVCPLAAAAVQLALTRRLACQIPVAASAE